MVRTVLRRRWKILVPVGLAGAGLLAFLGIGVFGVHTLFFDRVADDAPPVFASGAAAASVATVAEGDFIDRSHPGEGRAVVLTDGTSERFLRFEDFRTDNGPDLNVYLTTGPADGDSGSFDDDFIDLGDLRGNVGPQNYAIPEGVDLDRYDTVVVWCVRFGSAFTAADLAPVGAEAG